MEKCIIGALDLSFPSNWQLVSNIVGVETDQERSLIGCQYPNSHWPTQIPN